MALYNEVVALLREGKKMEAVRLIRDVEGISLADAKDSVAEIERRIGKPATNTTQQLPNPKNMSAPRDDSTAIIIMLITLLGLGAYIVAYFLGYA